MKKLFGLTIAALLIIGMVGGGTWAYFSDPEATNNNVLTAGVLDLTRDAASNVTTAFLTTGVSNVSPGESNTNSTLLANTAGTMAGELDINLGTITETAGIVGEFAGGADLGGKLYMAIWLDKDNGGSWDGVDVGLAATANTKYGYVAGASSTSTDLGTTTTLVDTALTGADDYWNGFKITITSGGNLNLLGVVTDWVLATKTLTVTAFPTAIASGVTYTLSGPLYYTMASYHSLGKYDNVLTMTSSAPGNSWDFNIEWLIPATVDNTIQGDAAKFNAITFTLEQPAAD